jgi:hypothetical protein
MKTRFLLAITAVGLGAAVAVPPVAAEAPGQDSVTGRATDCLSFDLGCFHPTFVDLDAHSGPSGENPSGTAAWQSTVGTNTFVGAEGAVSCLAVSGHTAIIGFNGVPRFFRTLVRVTDGGSSPGQDSFEAISQGFMRLDGTVPPPDCSSFPPPPAGDLTFSGGGVNDLGDIVVTDAPPTTYTQCRQAGWVKYGFASHAACIDYVHEQARQKCIFERVAHGITAFRAKYGLGPNHDHAMRHCVRLYTGV